MRGFRGFVHAAGVATVLSIFLAPTQAHAEQDKRFETEAVSRYMNKYRADVDAGVAERARAQGLSVEEYMNKHRADVDAGVAERARALGLSVEEYMKRYRTQSEAGVRKRAAQNAVSTLEGYMNTFRGVSNTQALCDEFRRTHLNWADYNLRGSPCAISITRSRLGKARRMLKTAEADRAAAEAVYIGQVAQ